MQQSSCWVINNAFISLVCVARRLCALTKKTRVGGEQLDELISERQNASAQGIYFPPFLCVRLSQRPSFFSFFLA
jgi:hypothetical protein